MTRQVCLLPNTPSAKISIHVFISLCINLNTQQDFTVAFSIQHGFFPLRAILLKIHNQMKGFEIKHKNVEVFAAVLLLLHFNSYQNQLPFQAPE